MKKTSAKLSTLVAVGGGLAALPAAAIELGEAQVNSSLGQPLRASIAYALAPNEAITGTCVSVQNGTPRDSLPSVGRASVVVANGVISITGNSVIREPLVSMRVNIRCPYTAQLSRDYKLFIDPAGTPARVAEQAAPVAEQVTPAAVQAAPVAVQAAPVAIQTPRAPVSDEPIANATRYRVQPGDSLSQIVQRIEDRPIGLWAAVGAIFDANPNAFIDDDPNQLKAGGWLDIPDFGAGAPLTVTDVFPVDTPVVAEAPPIAAAPADASAGYPDVAVDPLAVEALAADEAVVEEQVIEEPAVQEPAVEEPAVEESVAIESGTAVSDTTIAIPDTELESPTVTSSSPNVPTASVQSTPPETKSTSWFVWLAGTGLALIAMLLFFGRLVRERFSSSPIGAIAPPPQRRHSDDSSRNIEVFSDFEIELEDSSPTHENLALDADLIVGTGLQEGRDVDVAQDFGFAAPTDLDLELPEEMSSGGEESPQTDVIPPLNVEMQSILESEVLPEEEDAEDDYDMSVIVDATKMPFPDDVTQQDLEAIPVETSDETLITDDYTVSHEVDYKVLEQDYEDEFTATQALNNEIARAAEELALRMDEEFSDEEDTKEMSLASVTALDLTAQLPANNDDVISDLDDTGINEALTINMKDSDRTVEMPADDNTVEMPAKGKSA